MCVTLSSCWCDVNTFFAINASACCWQEQLRVTVYLSLQFGNTPLHIAVLTQNTTLARILLNAAAQAKKILNREGKSAVDVAREVDNGTLQLNVNRFRGYSSSFLTCFSQNEVPYCGKDLSVVEAVYSVFLQVSWLSCFYQDHGHQFGGEAGK